MEQFLEGMGLEQVLRFAELGSILLIGLFWMTFVMLRRARVARILRRESIVDIENDYEKIRNLYEHFNRRRDADFFDKWAEDFSDHRRDHGTVFAVARGLIDGITLGSTARRRHKRNELAAAIYLSQSVDGVISTASENLRTHVAATSVRIDYGFKLLAKAQRITNPVLFDTGRSANSNLARRLSIVDAKTHNVRAASSAFLDVATAAGAGGATALGLWGAVQVAGYASTGTAMVGLHGAAASSAGWAWFGGGSLASGGGGMALGHAILPGVGIAVTWAMLVSRLHRAANEIEQQIQQVEECNDTNMPVLARMVDVTGHYAKGSEDFRISLIGLHTETVLADRRLRRLGVLSDWIRRRRVKTGRSYYSQREMMIVDDLADAMDDFLRKLPSSQGQM